MTDHQKNIKETDSVLIIAKEIIIVHLFLKCLAMKTQAQPLTAWLRNYGQDKKKRYIYLWLERY